VGLRYLIPGLLLAVFAAAPAAAQPGTGGPSPPPAWIGFSTCMPVSANATLYMSTGTCVEGAEANAGVPVSSRATFRRLTCTTSAATGAGVNVDVTARAGVCGSLADVGAFALTIPGGGSPGVGATDASELLTVAARTCFALRVVTPAGLPGGVRVLCSMERSQ
jgi:hypothetical protein